MKKLILVLLFIVFIPLAWADELKINGYLKADLIRGSNHYVISNKVGNIKARIKPDPLWPSGPERYIIIDKENDIDYDYLKDIFQQAYNN